MVETQMRAGMEWIARTLRELGTAEGADIRPIGWNTDTLNLAASQHNFVVALNGQRQVITFDDEELEDLTGDPRLQILVEGDLREFLRDTSGESCGQADAVCPWPSI